MHPGDAELMLILHCGLVQVPCKLGSHSIGRSHVISDTTQFDQVHRLKGLRAGGLQAAA